MKKISLVIIPLLSLTALASCNKDNKDYEVICKDNVNYLLYKGVNKFATIVGYDDNLANEVTIPSKVNGYDVNAISDEAFVASNLTKITIPESVAYVGSRAFAECFYLTDVKLPNGLQFLSKNTFAECYSLSNINLPNSLAYIDSGAFLGCRNLASVTLPSSLFDIGSYAFASCSKLNNVNLASANVISINSYCFYNCESLTNIDLGNRIALIYDEAFSYCSNLKNIFIPSSIGYLGDNLFKNCNNDLKIMFESSKLPDLYSYTFSSGYPFALGTNTKTTTEDVFINDKKFQYSINDYSSDTPTAFLNYQVDNSDTVSLSDTITTKAGKNANITKIMPNAFASKGSLKTVDLSALTKLDYIGSNAFYYDTNLEKVILPTDANTYIDLGAFYKCRKLETITNLNKISELHGYTFAECYNLGVKAAFEFSENITSITSTDFAEWGTVQNQYIKIAKDAYEKDGEGVVTLNAKGYGTKAIVLNKSKTNDDTYYNNEYFSNAIISLEPKS